MKNISFSFLNTSLPKKLIQDLTHVSFKKHFSMNPSEYLFGFISNLKEQTIKELDELKPQALAKVYDLISELKRTNQAKKSKTTAADYLKVREALKQCKGSLSEDIILEREDRI